MMRRAEPPLGAAEGSPLLTALHTNVGDEAGGACAPFALSELGGWGVLESRLVRACVCVCCVCKGQRRLHTRLRAAAWHWTTYVT